MRTEYQKNHKPAQGYALLMTLAFISVSLLVLASLGKWTSNSSTMSARNNAYSRTVAAAEGATEVVISKMAHDFTHQALSSDLRTYNSLVPSAVASNGWATDYRFSDGHGNASQTEIVCTGWKQNKVLDSAYAGLFGVANSYRITSNAKQVTGQFSVSAGVSQEIQMTAIPLFQYAIFYTLDLEINPGKTMTVSGKTHSNGDIYLAPGASLNFADSVTASGDVIYNRNANDPSSSSSKKTPGFKSDPVEGVPTMTLPVGTNNSPSDVVKILDAPAYGENPLSELGRARLYNKADLIITTTKDSVTVLFNEYGDGSSFTTVARDMFTNSGYSFISTNNSFYDYREGKQVLSTELDVKALTNWLAGSGYALDLKARSQLSHQINSVYVNDQRAVPGKLPGVRLKNGRYLPAGGLTVATPQPLYVAGSYNAPDLTAGSGDTSLTRPAALISDAVTLLSPQWDDTYNSGTSIDTRKAKDMTVNAAFLSGIVESTTVSGTKHYSGGVENFPRFLENWDGTTLTYNGSMVVMFPSRNANSFWVDPSAKNTYYHPPDRKWAFDKNFLDVNKLPPLTPQVTVISRSHWNVVAATDK